MNIKKIPPSIKNPAIGIAVFALFLYFTEVGARVFETFHPSIRIDFDGGFEENSKVFIPDPTDANYRITSPTKRDNFNFQRFTTQKSKGILRVAVLGESSVKRLENKLPLIASEIKSNLGNRFENVEIINAGGNSYGSQRLLIVANELLDYAPDVLIVYLGNNEFEELEQLELLRPSAISYLEFGYHLAIVRVLVSALAEKNIERLKAEHSARVDILSHQPTVGRAWAHEYSQEEVDSRMRAFEAYLRAIVFASKSKGVNTAIGTIPSNIIHPYLPPSSIAEYDQVRELLEAGQVERAGKLSRDILNRAVGRHQSSDIENAIIRKIARESDIPLIDVEQLIADAEPHHIPGETLFEDHCHLNDRGNEILAGAISNYILESLTGSSGKTRF